MGKDVVILMPFCKFVYVSIFLYINTFILGKYNVSILLILGNLFDSYIYLFPGFLFQNNLFLLITCHIAFINPGFIADTYSFIRDREYYQTVIIGCIIDIECFDFFINSNVYIFQHMPCRLITMYTMSTCNSILNAKH